VTFKCPDLIRWFFAEYNTVYSHTLPRITV